MKYSKGLISKSCKSQNNSKNCILQEIFDLENKCIHFYRNKNYIKTKFYINYMLNKINKLHQYSNEENNDINNYNIILKHIVLVNLYYLFIADYNLLLGSNSINNRDISILSNLSKNLEALCYNFDSILDKVLFNNNFVLNEVYEIHNKLFSANNSLINKEEKFTRYISNLISKLTENYLIKNFSDINIYNTLLKIFYKNSQYHIILSELLNFSIIETIHSKINFFDNNYKYKNLYNLNSFNEFNNNLSSLFYESACHSLSGFIMSYIIILIFERNSSDNIVLNVLDNTKKAINYINIMTLNNLDIDILEKKLHNYKNKDNSIIKRDFLGFKTKNSYLNNNEFSNNVYISQKSFINTIIKKTLDINNLINLEINKEELEIISNIKTNSNLSNTNSNNFNNVNVNNNFNIKIFLKYIDYFVINSYFLALKLRLIYCYNKIKLNIDNPENEKILYINNVIILIVCNLYIDIIRDIDEDDKIIVSTLIDSLIDDYFDFKKTDKYIVNLKKNKEKNDIYINNSGTDIKKPVSKNKLIENKQILINAKKVIKNHSKIIIKDYIKSNNIEKFNSFKDNSNNMILNSKLNTINYDQINNISKNSILRKSKQISSNFNNKNNDNKKILNIKNLTIKNKKININNKQNHNIRLNNILNKLNNKLIFNIKNNKFNNKIIFNPKTTNKNKNINFVNTKLTKNLKSTKKNSTANNLTIENKVNNNMEKSSFVYSLRNNSSKLLRISKICKIFSSLNLSNNSNSKSKDKSFKYFNSKNNVSKYINSKTNNNFVSKSYCILDKKSKIKNNYNININIYRIKNKNVNFNQSKSNKKIDNNKTDNLISKTINSSDINQKMQINSNYELYDTKVKNIKFNNQKRLSKKYLTYKDIYSNKNYTNLKKNMFSKLKSDSNYYDLSNIKSNTLENNLYRHYKQNKTNNKKAFNNLNTINISDEIANFSSYLKEKSKQPIKSTIKNNKILNKLLNQNRSNISSKLNYSDKSTIKALKKNCLYSKFIYTE